MYQTETKIVNEDVRQCFNSFNSKDETGKVLDCAHPLFLNNGAPISWASSIMSVYLLRQGEPGTPHYIVAPLFNRYGWANTIPTLSSQTLLF